MLLPPQRPQRVSRRRRPRGINWRGVCFWGMWIYMGLLFRDLILLRKSLDPLQFFCIQVLLFILLLHPSPLNLLPLMPQWLRKIHCPPPPPRLLRLQNGRHKPNHKRRSPQPREKMHGSPLLSRCTVSQQVYPWHRFKDQWH